MQLIYIKGEKLKKKIFKKKGRINFQIAECYRLDVEPAQAETYYKRALKLKYQKDHPNYIFYFQMFLLKKGNMNLQLKIFVNILKFILMINHANNLFHHVNIMQNGLEMVPNI